VLLPSEGSGIEIEPLEPNRNVSSRVVPWRSCVVVTWSPPATGITAVTLSVAVPAGSPAVVTWYTQVSPTAAGKSGVPAKEPAGEVPVPALPADEDAGPADEDEAAGEDGAPEPEPEPEPQPARASPMTASRAAQPTDRREMELRRFICAAAFRGTSAWW